MVDFFKTDIFNSEFTPRSSSSFNLFGVSLPTNQDIYFISKWHEIFERYTTARIFVREAKKDDWSDWEHWFNVTDKDSTDKIMKLKLISDMYETALINYNILVDLSWTITYVSAEYVLYHFDKSGNILNADEIYGMQPIEEAYKTLRATENIVTTPTAVNNPFQFIKIMRPEFSKAIDTVVNFWSNFADSSIRSNYNYIKHKGKPIYDEICKLDDTRFFTLQLEKENYPSDIRDVQKRIALFQSIEELITFDDTLLFTYFSKLIPELCKAVNPSPMIF